MLIEARIRKKTACVSSFSTIDTIKIKLIELRSPVLNQPTKVKLYDKQLNRVD